MVLVTLPLLMSMTESHPGPALGAAGTLLAMPGIAGVRAFARL